jgi:hypothetical protein
VEKKKKCIHDDSESIGMGFPHHAFVNSIEAGATTGRKCMKAALPWQCKSRILMLHRHFTHFEPRDLVERFYHRLLFPKRACSHNKRNTTINLLKTLLCRLNNNINKHSDSRNSS